MKILLALLLLAGDPSFTDRWEAMRGKADKLTVAPATAPEPERMIEKPPRPQDAPRKRAERVVRHRHHHRVSRFKCHRVYTTKHRWHCQRGRG